jgi:cytochrome c peroxidase
MHNGQLYQFKSIIPQYRFYVKNNATLDTLLKHNGKLGFTMTDEEATQLKAFLETLNDSGFVKNPDFAEPDIKYTAPVF